jgi:toxin FitB
VILLDTNVLSALMQREPPGEVISWMNRQPTISVWTSSITVFEIECGLHRLPYGRRKQAQHEAFRGLISEELGSRILGFDVKAAMAAASISAALEAKGHRVRMRDVQIAGIAKARQARVATRNIRDFEHSVEVINPWTAGEH